MTHVTKFLLYTRGKKNDLVTLCTEPTCTVHVHLYTLLSNIIFVSQRIS